MGERGKENESIVIEGFEMELYVIKKRSQKNFFKKFENENLMRFIF